MDAGENGGGPSRGAIETALLASVGWASLTAEALDDLADDIAGRVGLERDELRRAVGDAFAGWRRDVDLAARRREEAFERLVGRLQLARRDELDDLNLRVSQLEHRLRLLEPEK